MAASPETHSQSNSMTRASLVVARCIVVLLLGSSWLQAQPSLPDVLQAIKPRSIGPANMSGRIVHLAVCDKEPRIQYVASATGGVWKTVNHGSTWTPVLDRQSTSSVGAVALFQADPKFVWVGMGEGNPRNSVTWGDGVLRSTDGGKTWKHLGLAETQHIGRIALHPKDPETAYVAALGRFWGKNPERGLFKTSDGGKTWQHVLKLDDETGCVDVALHPANPTIVYAAAYQVRRGSYSGGNPQVQTGPKAGLYKSENAGKTWVKMKQGLPDRPFGRCGLAVCPTKPDLVYAVIATDKTPNTLTGQAANLKLDLDSGGIFKSEDAGVSWTHVNSLVTRPFYYGQIRIDAQDPARIYVLGVSFHVSPDGGKTFPDKLQGAKGTHADHHALWIDPNDSNHLIDGCDGGLNYSWDRGANWEALKNLPITQFYAIGLDMRKPYRVYGGLQDNGTWGGPSATIDPNGIRLSEWFRLIAFDGYWAQVDPNDIDTVYCEGQYGNLHRVNVATGEAKQIRPTPPGKNAGKATKGNLVPVPEKTIAAFRFNWSSPIVPSVHEKNVVWFGGNHVFKSSDRGDTWAIASPDLTLGKPGPSEYSGHTLTALVESPHKKGLLFAGSDDGRVHRTRDGGKTWDDLSDKIPKVAKARWINRLVCSPHGKEAATVFVAIDRHREDDYAPYLFRSDDEGETWTSIAGDLPKDGPIHVLRVDPRNEKLLYVGNEYGLYFSWDAGKTWQKEPHLPTVPVHDLAVHPRDRELAIATHGRGIHILEVAALQGFSKSEETEAAIGELKTAWRYLPRISASLGIKAYNGENPPFGTTIPIWLAKKPAEAPTITVEDAKGKTLVEIKGKAQAGMQLVRWNLTPSTVSKGLVRPVAAGTYVVVLRVGEVTRRMPLVVESLDAKEEKKEPLILE
jgi:photosystem II stability/assembly factor-like uncharacterized protein